jgi:hypothetical protein
MNHAGAIKVTLLRLKPAQRIHFVHYTSRQPQGPSRSANTCRSEIEAAPTFKTPRPFAPGGVGRGGAMPLSGFATHRDAEKRHRCCPRCLPTPCNAGDDTQFVTEADFEAANPLIGAADKVERGYSEPPNSLTLLSASWRRRRDRQQCNPTPCLFWIIGQGSPSHPMRREVS